MKRIVLLALAAVASFAQPFQQVPFAAPPPPVVTSVSASLVGSPGGASYCYFVVATFPRGRSNPSASTCLFNAPSTLSGSNYVRLNWSAVAGATSYDVLRFTSPLAQPSGSCASCAVVSATSSTTFLDQGGATISYTFASAGPASGGLSINNRDYPQPRLVSDLAIQTPMVAFPDGTTQTTASSGTSPATHPVTGATTTTLACTSGAPSDLFNISVGVVITSVVFSGSTCDGHPVCVASSQDGTGHAVTYGAAFLTSDPVDATPNKTTTQCFTVATGVASASGPAKYSNVATLLVGGTQPDPCGTVAAGTGCSWYDSVDLLFKYKNENQTIAIPIFPGTCPGGQVVTAVTVAGVICSAAAGGQSLTNTSAPIWSYAWDGGLGTAGDSGVSLVVELCRAENLAAAVKISKLLFVGFSGSGNMAAGIYSDSMTENLSDPTGALSALVQQTNTAASPGSGTRTAYTLASPVTITTKSYLVARVAVDGSTVSVPSGGTIQNALDAATVGTCYTATTHATGSNPIVLPPTTGALNRITGFGNEPFMAWRLN